MIDSILERDIYRYNSFFSRQKTVKLKITRRRKVFQKEEKISINERMVAGKDVIKKVGIRKVELFMVMFMENNIMKQKKNYQKKM